MSFPKQDAFALAALANTGQGFDPDAYLAKKQASAAQPAGFDPDAYIQAKTAESAPQVGAGETFLNSTAQALPMGKQLTNALAALQLQVMKHVGGLGEPSAKLTPQARAELAALAEGGDAEAKAGLAADARGNVVPGLVDSYRNLRDQFDARTAAGKDQHGLAAGLGTGTGIALSLLAPLPKVSVGAGAGGRVLSNALTGGAYGAANSAANSKGDLLKGEIGQILSDAAGVEGLKQTKKDAAEGKYGRALLDLMGSGALGGAGTGAALSTLVEGVRAIPGIAKGVKNVAISQGRRGLTNGADSLSARAAVPDAAVEEAIRSRAMRPLGSTEGTLERLGQRVEEADAARAKIIAGLEARGVRGPDARAVADELMNRGASLEPHTLNEALPAEYLKRAEQLIGKSPTGDLSLTQAERLKGSMQDLARYGKVEETPLNAVKRDIASVLRRSNEEAIAKAAASSPKDAELQRLAAEFVPAKQKLGNLLTAQEAASRGAARGAQRGAFGLTDKMFAAAGLASGNPAGMAAAAANNLLSNGRGSSTVASLGLKLADLLSSNPGAGGSAGEAAALLGNALRKSESMPLVPATAELTPDEKAMLLRYAEATQKKEKKR